MISEQEHLIEGYQKENERLVSEVRHATPHHATPRHATPRHAQVREKDAQLKLQERNAYLDHHKLSMQVV